MRVGDLVADSVSSVLGGCNWSGLVFYLWCFCLMTAWCSSSAGTELVIAAIRERNLQGTALLTSRLWGNRGTRQCGRRAQGPFLPQICRWTQTLDQFFNGMAAQCFYCVSLKVIYYTFLGEEVYSRFCLNMLFFFYAFKGVRFLHSVLFFFFFFLNMSFKCKYRNRIRRWVLISSTLKIVALLDNYRRWKKWCQ